MPVAFPTGALFPAVQDWFDSVKKYTFPSPVGVVNALSMTSPPVPPVSAVAEAGGVEAVKVAPEVTLKV
jgi:hypothetical protein